jgi:hypothetical protein
LGTPSRHQASFQAGSSAISVLFTQIQADSFAILATSAFSVPRRAVNRLTDTWYEGMIHIKAKQHYCSQYN